MTATARSDRESFIDVTRGVAMVCVMIAHFGWIYFTRNPGTPFLILSSSMLFAAPTFMLVSGMLLGFVRQTRPGRFDAFRVKLTDRGLFLLTVGHVVISLAYLTYGGGLRGAFRHAQILDAVGVAVLVGPWILIRTRAVQRLVVAASLFVLSWMVILWWEPGQGLPALLKSTLVGGGGWWLYNFPLVPWFAWYLVGTVVGEGIAVRQAAQVRAFLFRSAAASLAGAAMLWLAAKLVAASDILSPGPLDTMRRLASHTLKLPPSPTFFLYWGGIGLLLIFAVYLIDTGGRLPRARRVAAMVGQNSLFIFLLQEHMYVLVLWTWNPPFAAWWPLLLVASIALAIAITSLWHRTGWNRFLTVGYGRWWGPRPAAVSARSA